MKILVAPNALKGSIDAAAAARAIAEGLARGMPTVETIELPTADGGDGTLDVLIARLGGEVVESSVTDPLGHPVSAKWGLIGKCEQAIIEVARSSGLALVPEGRRDAMRATSYGAGQLVRAALDRGCRRIVLGLGGSATVDGGAGIVEALGARLLDARGAPIGRGGGGLADLDRIDVSLVDARLRGVDFVLACDVDNVLLGEDGAARRFGPQKGATNAMVEALEHNLARWADVIARDLGRDVRRLAHGGAAGGTAAGVAGILGARLERGIDLVLQLVQFDEHLKGSDLVITAEGRVDVQTLANKAPCGVAYAARRAGVPVVLLAGGLADETTTDAFRVFDAILSITRGPMALEEAVIRARENLTWTAEQLGRLLSIHRSLARAGRLS
jgi:glycerate 2-kinase